MNKEDFKYYKTIAKIQSAITKSESYYEAIKSSIQVILDSSCAEYAVVWHCEKNVMRPYYWLSPVDLTNVTIPLGKSIISEALDENKTIAINVADKGLLKGIDTKSLVITPFNFSNSDKGCIFFISPDFNFSDDDKNVLEILSMLLEMTMNESSFAFREWQKRNMVMSCKSICKSFESGDTEVRVLKGVNFDIFEGEFLCLLGESGCGKSTFLNIIGGLDRADSGTFEFMGKEYQDVSDSELTEYRRKNIGFIFQSYNLMPNLTSKQNLDLIGELVDNQMDSKEALNIVGLSDKINSYPSQLSGGQQQRVSIARALVKNPKIIMADEPTAALDYNTSIEVLQVLTDVVKRGTTLIMVTHNEEITKMADRVVRFRDGKVYEVTINNNPKSATELVW